MRISMFPMLLAMLSFTRTTALKLFQHTSKSASSTRKFSNISELVDKAIASNDVMVFSKTYCPYCTKAKDTLAGIGVKFGVYELDNMKEGNDIQAKLLEKTGQRTVPNVFVKGKHVGGCDKTLEAIANGTFQKMLSS